MKSYFQGTVSIPFTVKVDRYKKYFQKKNWLPILRNSITSNMGLFNSLDILEVSTQITRAIEKEVYDYKLESGFTRN